MHAAHGLAKRRSDEGKMRTTHGLDGLKQKPEQHASSVRVAVPAGPSRAAARLAKDRLYGAHQFAKGARSGACRLGWEKQ